MLLSGVVAQSTKSDTRHQPCLRLVEGVQLRPSRTSSAVKRDGRFLLSLQSISIQRPRQRL